MKLVDILARELKEWPGDFPGLTQSAFNAEIYSVKDCSDPSDSDTLPHAPYLSKRHDEPEEYPLVTRAQWQAAVEALRGRQHPKQPAIDWSKAPDWAGAVIKNHSDDYYWVSQFGGISCRQRVGAIEPDDTSACMGENSLWSLVSERPSSPWSGEGRPPVGLICEHRVGMCMNWSTATVLAFGEKKVFYRDSQGLEWSRASDEVEFRPIRTPEQIAAEERKSTIREMAEIIGKRIADIHAAEDLYEAGYRKQVQP